MTEDAAAGASGEGSEAEGIAAADALLRENLGLAQAIARLMDSENGDQIYQQLIGSIADPIVQMYRIANLANLTVEQQQEVLAANRRAGADAASCTTSSPTNSRWPRCAGRSPSRPETTWRRSSANTSCASRNGPSSTPLARARKIRTLPS